MDEWVFRPILIEFCTNTANLNAGDQSNPSLSLIHKFPEEVTGEVKWL